MYLRKVLAFNTVLGVTLPGEYTDVLGLERGQYAEIFLRDSKTIVIKKHDVKPHRLTILD